MKYMKWRDLQPGDVIRYNDEFLEYLKTRDGHGDFYNEYKNKDFIINEVYCGKDYIIICADNFCINSDISYNGNCYRSQLLKFKIVKIKETL